MKCIKMATGDIRKVSDIEALKAVDAGKASWTSKTAFKAVNGKGKSQTESKAGSRSSMKKMKSAASKKSDTI